MAIEVMGFEKQNTKKKQHYAENGERKIIFDTKYGLIFIRRAEITARNIYQ